MSVGNSKQARETIAIDAPGEAVAVKMHGATMVSLAVRGDAPAEYVVDARLRRGEWVENVGETYAGAAEYTDLLQTAVSDMRVRCTAGSGGAGDTATITLSAGGG